jgi:hypothetical protein
MPPRRIEVKSGYNGDIDIGFIGKEGQILIGI